MMDKIKFHPTILPADLQLYFEILNHIREVKCVSNAFRDQGSYTSFVFLSFFIIFPFLIIFFFLSLKQNNRIELFAYMNAQQ